MNQEHSICVEQLQISTPNLARLISEQWRQAVLNIYLSSLVNQTASLQKYSLFWLDNICLLFVRILFVYFRCKYII